MKARCLVDCKNTLGESCFWDPRDGCLWWTDIEERCAYRRNEDGTTTRFDLPDRAGFILPREKPGFVIGFPGHVALADRDLQIFTRLHDVETDLPQTRINDAAVDPFGGIVFGTFDETPDMAARRPIASVYRLAPDGALSLLFGGVIVSNGLAFSPGGDCMYFADTADGTIRRFRIGERFSSFDEIEPLAGPDVAPGMPDGATVDSEGNYWNARVWGGCVVRIAPDGSVTVKIDLPTKGPTCVTLGGRGLSDLYITTLRVRHSQSELDNAPEAGGIFCAPVDGAGLPQRLSVL